jgi:uncharacterized DUF497 family protein
MKIKIEWDEESEEHIWRHHVDPEEVEEVLQGPVTVQRTRKKQCLVLGQTFSGGYLAIVIGRRRSGKYRVVTARDTDESERNYYRRRGK